MKEYDFSSANTYLKGNLQKTGPISDTVMKGMKYYLGICVLLIFLFNFVVIVFKISVKLKKKFYFVGIMMSPPIESDSWSYQEFLKSVRKAMKKPPFKEYIKPHVQENLILDRHY